MLKINYLNRALLNVALGLTLSVMGSIAYADNSASASPASATQSVSDTLITSLIKTKYMQNPILKAFDIHVETTNGVVKLTGLTDSDSQYERAIILAENTNGVKKVDSANLKIKGSKKPVNDSIITAKIKGLLLKNKLVSDETEANPWPIHVETKNGVVFITGTVENDYQKNQVVKIAKLTDGVKSVKADLQIQAKK